MGERDDAKHSIEQTRARMSAISEELARRSSPEYLKGKARSMARDKTMEMRDRVVDSPWALAALGGAFGAIAGRLLADYAREERAGGTSHVIRERASERPITWALGSIAIGALFGATMPLSGRERRIFRPAKVRLREAGEHAVEDAKAFGRGMEEGLGLREPEVERHEEVPRTSSVEAPGPGSGPPPTTH